LHGHMCFPVFVDLVPEAYPTRPNPAFLGGPIGFS